MRKNIFRTITVIIFSVILFTAIPIEAVNVQNDGQYLRIGLYSHIKSNSNVTIINNDGFNVGIWNEKFIRLFDIDNDIIMAEKSYSQESINDLYCLRIEKTYNDFDKVLKDYYSYKENDIDVYIVFNSSLEIWIGKYWDKQKANTEKNNLNSLVNGTLSVARIDENMIFINDDKNNHLLAFDNESKVLIKANSDDERNLIKIGKNLYRDYVTFGIDENRLIAINYTTLKHYLYGVVPNEMSWDWPLESLKAQAVAARSYALLNLGRHGDDGFDLCDEQHCQVYSGYKVENNKTNKAVDDTEGQVIKYNGKIIDAVYHSTSGGHTENSENIWQTETPYLKGIEDQFSTDSPNSTWKLVMTRADIKQKLYENEIDIGDVEAIEPVSYSENGRVLEVIIRGSTGSCILKKEEVRKIFGYSAIKSTWFSVESDSNAYVMSAYSIEPVFISLNQTSVVSAKDVQLANRSSFNRVNISNGFLQSSISLVPDTYTFEGKGWGHGLGMSQWGAKKMAELGYNYQEILQYYYSGVKIE